MYTLGLIPDAWNERAQCKELRSNVEREWNRHLERSMIPVIDGTCLKCLILIKGRTLGWQKFAEAIPMHHFLNGILDEDGEVRIGIDGLPYCSGTGIAKEDTIRAALKRLELAGLITRLPGVRGFGTPVNVFLPCSQRWLAESVLAAGGGVLPGCVPGLFRGEHVATKDEKIWEVVGGRDHFIDIARVSAPGQYVGEKRTVVSPDVRRLSLADWREFAGR